MKKEIILHNRHISYTLRINNKSRSLRIIIHPDGEIVVSVPTLATTSLIERFITSKSTWLLKHLNKIEKNPKIIVSKNSAKDFLLYKETARTMANERLKYFNAFYSLKWQSITIRNQKTRWGSCSKRGTLSFSYKIALLSSEQRDYIVVHELCHLGEFNHSLKFWALVEKTIPNYKDIRKQIKRIQ